MISYNAQTIAQDLPKNYFVKDESGNFDKLSNNDLSADLMHCTPLIEKYRSDGYVLANEDSTEIIGDSVVFQIYKGAKYEYVYLNWDNFPSEFLVKFGINPSSRKKYPASLFANHVDKILEAAQKSGYPFATVYFDSITVKDFTIALSLGFRAGQFIVMDTLNVKGLSKTNGDFLARFLHLGEGAPYSEFHFSRISNQLLDVDYLSLVSVPEVDFVNGKALVSFQTKELKANTFDGIVGLLQNPNDDKLTITGMVDLDLYNLGGKGRSIQVNWQQQRALSQTLDLVYEHPLLLGSSVGLIGKFNQLKQDTSFVSRNAVLGFDVPLGNFKATISYQRNAARQLGNRTFTEIGQLADFNIDFYELSIGYANFKRTDYLNRGIRLKADAALGDKKVSRAGVDSVNQVASINPRSIQYRLGMNLTAQSPVFKSLILWSSFTSRIIANDQLYANDLFRLGGLNSLRGFNELEFFSNKYLLSNMEMRWFWADNSFVFAFFDQAFLQQRVLQEQKNDTPLGFGLGLSLNTGSGLFTLVYGLGKSATQPVNFNQAKIHFGFSSKF